MRIAALCFALLLLSNPFETKAQCSPDTTRFEYIYPDAIEQACIIRNQPYSAVVSVFCPPQIATAIIDSIEITQFSGLPNGLSYQTYPTNTIASGRHGCVEVSGQTNDPAGRYPISYNGRAFTNQGVFTVAQLQGLGVLPEYFFDVAEDQASCRISLSSNTDLLQDGMMIKRTGNTLEIRSNLVQPEPTEASWFDLQGKKLYTTNLTPGSVEASYLSLPSVPGIYLLQLQNKNGRFVSKWLF
jgi:hypothetical protein